MSAKDLQVHKKQLIKPKKLTGLVRNNNSKSSVTIYDAYVNEKRIKEFKTNNELKPLIDLVGKWRFYVGIKEELTQDELLMNINFIRENFSDLNLFDIKEAIDLSLNGKLQVDVEHYQSFTPMYISRILTAYKKYRGNIIVKIRKELEAVELNKPKKFTNNEKLELTKDNLQVLYESKDSDSFYDYGSVAYNFIKKNKLVRFTKELVDEAMKFGKNNYTEMKRKSAYKDAVLDSENHLKNAREKQDAMIRNLARNYVVRKWLNGYKPKDWKHFLKNISIDMI